MRRHGLDPLTRPAPAAESAGGGPPSPTSGVRWTPSGSGDRTPPKGAREGTLCSYGCRARTAEGPATLMAGGPRETVGHNPAHPRRGGSRTAPFTRHVPFREGGSRTAPTVQRGHSRPRHRGRPCTVWYRAGSSGNPDRSGGGPPPFGELRAGSARGRQRRARRSAISIGDALDPLSRE
jgi:hypothetical protein